MMRREIHVKIVEAMKWRPRKEINLNSAIMNWILDNPGIEGLYEFINTEVEQIVTPADFAEFWKGLTEEEKDDFILTYDA